MKNKYLQCSILALCTSFLFSCSDSDDPVPVPADRLLSVADTSLVFFRTLTGSSEGGIAGLEIAKYHENHLRTMNNFILRFENMVEGSSIKFFGDTDSAEISGYVQCDYLVENDIIYTRVTTANKKVFKYQFEDNKMMILFDPEKDEWLVLGYGDKNKIEVYLETKLMATASSLYDPELLDNYFWEAPWGTAFDATQSVSPEKAKSLLTDPGWSEFFYDVYHKWSYIPAAYYFGEHYRSADDLKYKYEGASWSVYKMTYLPEI